MRIRGFTPGAVVAGQPLRFELRPKYAAAWIAITLQQRRTLCPGMLATCPESLLWCLANVDRQQVCSVNSLSSVFMDSGSCPAVENASECVFKRDSVRRFVESLKKHADCKASENAVNKLELRLCELVAESSELVGPQVLDWLQGVQFAEDFWGELAQAAIDSRDVTIEIPVKKCTDFEQRLNSEKMASMKQLAYGASHEINNPLANIASRAQTLLMDEKDPDRRLRLAKINQQAFRAHEMIADMMLFAHPPQPDFSTANPVEIVQQVVAELRPLAEQQGTRIDFESDPDHLPQTRSGIQVDKTQLAVAIKAMVNNSLESLLDSGVIVVRVDCCANSGSDETSRSVLEITVADDGPGIAADVIKHIFDPFFSGREAGRGLGFGLSKAWRIAELHGGEILAESPSHGGARFCLRIPYGDAA